MVGRGKKRARLRSVEQSSKEDREQMKEEEGEGGGGNALKSICDPKTKTKKNDKNLFSAIQIQ